MWEQRKNKDKEGEGEGESKREVRDRGLQIERQQPKGRIRGRIGKKEERREREE